MVVQSRESTDGDGEDLRQFFEPVFDPGFPIERSLTEQKRLANAPRDAVIPASDREIDETGASDCHGVSPECVATMYRTTTRSVKVTPGDFSGDRSRSSVELRSKSVGGSQRFHAGRFGKPQAAVRVLSFRVLSFHRPQCVSFPFTGVSPECVATMYRTPRGQSRSPPAIFREIARGPLLSSYRRALEGPSDFMRAGFENHRPQCVSFPFACPFLSQCVSFSFHCPFLSPLLSFHLEERWRVPAISCGQVRKPQAAVRVLSFFCVSFPFFACSFPFCF